MAQIRISPEVLPINANIKEKWVEIETYEMTTPQFKQIPTCYNKEGKRNRPIRVFFQ